MKKELKTEILIHSNPKKVWDILMDFENYPIWNPFITSIKGEVVSGNKISVKIVPPGSKGMIIKPRIKTVNPNRQLSWLGRLFVAGIFDGKHSFQLIDNENGTTTFIHSESFNGLFVPFMNKMIDQQVKSGFEMMNQKLKEVAEQ